MKKYSLLIIAAFLFVACEESTTHDCQVQTGTRDGMVLVAYDDGNGNSLETASPTDGNGIATLSGVPNSVGCGAITTRGVPMYLE